MACLRRGGRRSAVGGRWSAVGGRRVAIDGRGGGGGAGDGRRGGSGLGLWFVVELFFKKCLFKKQKQQRQHTPHLGVPAARHPRTHPPILRNPRRSHGAQFRRNPRRTRLIKTMRVVFCTFPLSRVLAGRPPAPCGVAPWLRRAPSVTYGECDRPDGPHAQALCPGAAPGPLRTRAGRLPAVGVAAAAVRPCAGS